MPSHLHLALLSKHVYFPDGGFVDGWKCIQTYNDEQGLGAAVYTNNNNEMVIAFRGTDTSDLNNFVKNIVTNFDIARGYQPNTLKNAHEFVQKVRDKRTLFDRFLSLLKTQKENTLYLVGHSLGGTIAALVAYNLFIAKNKKYHVVTFENTGIAQHIDNQHLHIHATHFNNHFTTYLADPNVINTNGRHIGKVIHVHIKPHESTLYAKGNYYFYHAVDCIANDVMRVLSFLLLLNILLVISSGINNSSQNLLRATHQASSYLPQGKYMSNADSNSFSSMLLYFFIGLSLFMLEKVIKKTISTTSRQHPIEAIISEFIRGKGQPFKYSEIEKWPDAQQFSASHFKHTMLWINPFRHPSTFTINKAQELHEKMIESIDGYQVKPPAFRSK